MALSKDNPKNKLVDGKVMEHILLLLKKYIEANREDSIKPIKVINTDSEQVKELVYNIVYGLEEDKPSEDELINTNIPLVSYLIQLINNKVENSYKPQTINFATTEDIIDIFKLKYTEIGYDNLGCLQYLNFATKQDIYDIFKYEGTDIEINYNDLNLQNLSLATKEDIYNIFEREE